MDTLATVVVWAALFAPDHRSYGLPPHAECIRIRDQTWEIGKWCNAMADKWRATDYGGNAAAACTAASWEQNRLWYVWDEAAKAVDPRAPWILRNTAVNRLVDMVGWRAIVTGELPGPYGQWVPIE